MQTILGSGGAIGVELAKALANKILDEVKSGALTALIARSADVYGPGVKKTSILTETVFDRLAKGKKAFWLFDPVMKEMAEMMYQYNSEYVFDSSKFEKRFDFEPTPYTEGIKEIVSRDYKQNLPK